MQMPQQPVRQLILRPNASPAPGQPPLQAPPTVRNSSLPPGYDKLANPASWVPVPTGPNACGIAPVGKRQGPVLDQHAGQAPVQRYMEHTPSCKRNIELEGSSSEGHLDTEELLQLRQRLAEALDELANLREESTALRAGMDGAVANNALRAEVLEKGLAEEIEARCELERGLGKDLRNFVKSEMEHAREMMMREMRERMDGQKVLREEVQLQQAALASFTGRVDEAIIELRTELPRLGQENAMIKAEFERLAQQCACHIERMEALERSMAEEAQERCVGLKSLNKEFREHLAQCVSTHQTELRKQLDELNSRVETANIALGKEFREHVTSETERVTTQVVEIKKLHNELRLRSDVAQNLLTKDLRDHVALEVERLAAQVAEMRRLFDELGSRADESHKALGKDLREHVALESKDLRDHLLLEREQKEKEVAELRRLNNELSSRMDAAHGALSKDLRDYVALEAERMAQQISEMKRPLDELGARTNATQAAVQSVHEHADQLEHELMEARTSLDHLGNDLEEAQGQCLQQASDLEKKVTDMDIALRSCVETTVEEVKMGLHSWVETTVVNRVNSLDRGLRTEMAERSSAIQQVVGKVSHNAERWCQLQAKFDEILVEMHRSCSPVLGASVDGRASLNSAQGGATQAV